jgi:hypothetical protein
VSKLLTLTPSREHSKGAAELRSNSDLAQGSVSLLGHISFSSHIHSPPTVYIHPLCPDNFEDMVLNLDAGVRSIIILVNRSVREKLLQDFATIIHPYSGFVLILYFESFSPFFGH